MLHSDIDNNLIDHNQALQGCGPFIPPASANLRPLRQQIFEHVRSAGCCARIDIAHNLNISPASVTAITTELIEAGFLEETTSRTRDDEPVRGRPPVSLAVRPEAFYVGGIKLSADKNTAAIVDFAGNVIGSASISQDIARRTPNETIDQAYQVLMKALEDANLEISTLSSIGLGVPGLVETETGTVIWSPMIDQRGSKLQNLASKKFGLPVNIENDANILTLAELWFGKARSVSDFAVVTIEHGIGMGMVINHKLYRGALGLGMEFGHTKIQLDGALCRCGQRGCLEAYVADYALVREAATALGIEISPFDEPNKILQKLFEQAKAGNEAASSIFKRAGRFLAAGLSNIVNIFDPSLVIISGERMQYDFLYADEVLAEMKTLTLDRNRKQPTIEINAWGNLIWAKGAAALALSTLTDRTLGTR